MNQEKSIINCPQCGEEIDVNDILYNQVDEQLKKKYNNDLAKEKEKFDEQSTKLNKEREKFEADKELQEENIKEQVKEEVKQRELALKKRYKAEAEEEQSDALKSLRDELEEKSGKIKELNKTSIGY